MYCIKVIVMVGAVSLFSGISGQAQTEHVKYVPKIPYPMWDELEKRRDSLKAIEDSLTSQIRDRQKQAKKDKKITELELRYDFSRIQKPGSPDDFTTQFHNPPVPQDYTSTCWSFSGLSYIESEVHRLTGRTVKLSEMYIVYFEYLEKIRRYVRERGELAVGPGSEGNAVTRMMELYGVVPEELFPGHVTDDVRHDHTLLEQEIDSYLAHAKAHDLWNEDQVLGSVKIILDKHLGHPPESFVFEGRTLTPKDFLKDILKVNLDDYVLTMSTLKQPFYTYCEFEVPDNWWHDSSYYNLPLAEFNGVLKQAIMDGFTLDVATDNSEPGCFGKENIAVVPSFDIPQGMINQDSREFRLDNGTTTDDHGVHLVGYTRLGGRDWYLMKDSGSGSRRGTLKGYYYFRDDYIRLKVLSYMVHKDALKDLFKKGKDRSVGEAKAGN